MTYTARSSCAYTVCPGVFPAHLLHQRSMKTTTQITAALLLVAGGLTGQAIASQDATATAKIEKKQDAEKMAEKVTFWVLETKGKGPKD